MQFDIKPLISGFPAKSERGYLGWSSILLIRVTKNNEQKNYLYDTGGFNEREQLLRLLKSYSIDRNAIDGIIISHLHFDHAVNWVLFPESEIYIHMKELYPPLKIEDLAVPEFHKEALIKNKQVHFVDENDDIDGMKVLYLPGHTQGLIGLDIHGTFLVSDAIKNRTEIEGGQLSNIWDEDVARESIKKIIKHADMIYPGHDVPLVKNQNKWRASKKAEEKIILANSLLNETNQDVVNITIKE